MEVGRDEVGDAYEAARISLQAMAETDEVELRVAHWRNAVKYAALGRDKLVGVASCEAENGDALTSNLLGGSGHW